MWWCFLGGWGRRWDVSIQQCVPVPLGCEVTLSPQPQAQLSLV